MSRGVKESGYIVGIGASAGGLEALETFFKTTPPDTGLTFVVIQHLSPDFKSLMDDLLSRHTTMKIIRVDEDTKIFPNCVYLIPPKKNLTIRGDILSPTDFAPNTQLRLPIDHFFVGLAEEYGHRAIAVILSGTGSDGTRGATAVRENAGLVIAQDPSSCKFDGMPTSIVRAGIADYILPPDQIPGTIVDYVTHSAGADRTIRESVYERDVDKVGIILNLLRSVDGVDFSSYRISTVARRIERRVKHHSLRGLDEYIELLGRDPRELEILHGEMLIGVTRFFRDLESFELLKSRVIPYICEPSRTDPVRIWTAGCSTGEEAYSVAILFLEHFRETGISFDFKVFATDIDRDSLAVAQAALFDASAVVDVPPDILERYFVRQEGKFLVNAHVRKRILFSHHNVVKDPPFTRLDLVTCRNLLIYFQGQLQLKALSMFHFGLRPKGYLFLGSSETLGEIADEFDVISAQTKMFQKRRDVRLAMGMIGMAPPLSYDHVPTQMNRPALRQIPPASESRLLQVYETLLNEFVPPSLLVNENLTIQHVFGMASDVLEVGSGRASFEVSKMLPRELAVSVAAAVAQCTKTLLAVTFNNISCKVREQQRSFDIVVRPLGGGALSRISTGNVFLVLLITKHERAASVSLVESQEDTAFQLSDHVAERIMDLEEQLQVTRETLQSTIEELETTNEELQSTNEELMSSNEELQSANEELHSVNEELYTVNSEYQNKIRELMEANSDIEFLVNSSRIGIIFLETDLSIRRFTPGVSSLISLRSHDVGRPITELTFATEHVQIIDMIKAVQSKELNQSREVVLGKTTYLVDVSLQNSQSIGKPSIVLSILDVSSIKEASELRRTFLDFEQFTSFVSHDFQKPISRLSLEISELLEILPKNEHVLSRCGERIQATTFLLNAMVKKLLDYARVRTRGNAFENCDAEAVVREAARLAGLTEGQLQCDPLPFVFGDSEQLIRVFQILFENSVMHSKRGDALEVCVKCNSTAGNADFIVYDNGPGLPLSPGEDSFRVFNRLSDGDANHLGVGLAIARRILQRHRSDLEFHRNDLSHRWHMSFSLLLRPMGES
jgi:two-component system CheB/CheR fusion protein